MSISPFSIPPFIAAVFFLYLGLFVFFKNPKAALNISFLLTCLSSFIWEFTYSIAFNVTDYEVALKLMKIGYVGVIFIPLTIFQFFHLFLEMKKRIDRFILYISYPATVFFLISLFSGNLLVSGLYKYFWGFYPKTGIVQPFLVALLVIGSMRISYNIVDLLLHPASQDKEKRSQRLVVLCGYTVYLFAIIDFVPNYGFEIYPFGFVFALTFLIAVAYSIVRQHLFDMRNIAAEALTLFLVIILGLRLFFVEVLQNTFLDIVVFSSTLVVGFFLIRSVTHQVKQREELAHLNTRLDGANKQLKNLNENLEEKVAEQTHEVRKAYEVEKKARVDLQELDKAKDQFILTTQHHLRTPLTIMKGFVEEALEKEKEISPTVKEYLQKSLTASERMTGLINDLLNVSQIEVGKTILNPQPTDLSTILNEIHDELKLDIQEKRLAFSLAFSPEAKRAKAIVDPRVIKAALYNILDNAVKYTSQGGITLTGNVVIHPIEKIRFLRITIADTGIGIEKDELPKIFNRYFERGEEAQKIYTAGRGLGLSLSKNMIDLHGGRITVDSPGRGKGSTFIVELPVL